MDGRVSTGITDRHANSLGASLKIGDDFLLVHTMLDISIDAMWQEHKCKVSRFSDLANLASMDGLDADTKLINHLIDWSGRNASNIAADIGAAVTTITRPANGKATTRLSRNTLALLMAKYPDFPGWNPDNTARQADQPEPRTVDAGETVSILRLNLALPMGHGATVDDYIEEEPFTFDLGYVRSFTRTPPDRLRLALGVGDSMFPTLMSSDLVWIDSTQRVLNQSDRIWAVSINGAAAIKRLRPLKDNRVLVISDNKAIGDYEVGRDEILIGGRVIRFARDV